MLGFFSKLFEGAVKQRNARFDKQKSKITNLDVPVFSVGNLSVGGTGKTPFVVMLAKLLLDMRHRPAVIGKGYKRNSKGGITVSDGTKIFESVSAAGDEMLLVAQKVPVPVFVHDDKTEAAVTASRKFNIDAVIVDDGFQHRNLGRDLDILLIDKNTVDDPQLLPKGRLREPPSSLARADVVCLTGNFDLPDEFNRHIRKDQLIIKVKGYANKLYHLDTGEVCSQAEFVNVKKSCIAVSGIANPDRFSTFLGILGYRVIHHEIFSDHHAYLATDIARIAEVCRSRSLTSIVTTEKDAVKFTELKDSFLKNEITCLVLPFSLRITDGQDEFIRLVKSRFEKK